MQDRTIRTIGASVVLAGIVVAGLFQVSSAADEVPTEIVAADPSTSAADSVVSIPESPTSTPAEPFVYRVGVLSGISTDNFWAYYGAEPSVWNSYILGPTKPALYSLDAVTGSLVPELAVGDVSPTWDAKGWRVRADLQPGSEWSDGSPVTASDLVFTFETVRRLELGGSWADGFPAEVESVRANGDHQVVIEFSERPTLSVWPYGVGLAPVMPRHVWAGVAAASAAELYGQSGQVDVSGGPLVLRSVSDGLLVSEANAGYWGEGTPDEVEYHVYPDDASLVAAVADGAVDTALTPKGLPPEQLRAVSDDPGVEVVSSPANATRYLGFNLAREPMSDRAFRSALALLIDREELARQIPQTGEVAWAMLPSANTQWFDADRAQSTKDRYTGAVGERVATALDLLTEAGYAWDQPPSVDEGGALVPGKGLTIDGRAPQTLTILTPGDAYDPARPEYVRRIADTLAILGFDARPVETDFDTVVDLAFTPGDDGALHYDMYLLGWTLGNPALPGYYRTFFAPNGPMNNTGYSSGRFNAALHDYETAFNVREARAALWAMEQALSTDLPYLPLYNSELTEIYRSDRVGFDIEATLGGLQGRLGGIGDVTPRS